MTVQYFESPDDNHFQRLYRRERVLFDQLWSRMRTLAAVPLSSAGKVDACRARVATSKRIWADALRALDAER